MKTVFKKITAAAAAAVLLAACIVVDVPEKLAASAADVGAAVEEHTHDGWVEWTSDNSLPTTSGNYYLSKDVTVSSTTTIGSSNTISLCLNGNTITYNNTSRAVSIASGASFSLYDCGGNGKLVRAGDGVKYYNICAFYVEGSFMMYGGTISGFNTGGSGGGVDVRENGTFVMNGGTISGNIASGNGGGVHIWSNGSFTMNGGTISDNTAGCGGGVWSSGDFTLNDGKILNNKITKKSSGGGVSAENGTFKMLGGVISGNDAPSGGGVCCERPVIFTMEGGEISNNTAGTGGGVFIFNTDFKMLGGKISGNKANGSVVAFDGAVPGQGGGVCCRNSSDFTMTGGEISNNTANSDGGGVYIKGNFSLKNSVLSGNTASGSGGGVYSNNKISMSNSTIKSNTAHVNGGGVYIKAGNNSISDNSSITNNTAGSDGGGVYSAGGTIYMDKGSITNNTASNDGGGVYNGGSTHITIRDSTISDNTADGSGGGVYHIGNSVNIGSKSYITSNKNSDGSASNVYLSGQWKLINAESNFDTDSEVGVTSYTAPSCQTSVAITRNLSADVSQGFSSDDPKYGIAYEDNVLKLTGDHSYSAEYTDDKHWLVCSVCQTKTGEEPHILNDGEITQAATCTEKGVKTYSCNVCDFTKTEEIDAAGHTFSADWTSDETHHWHAADCEHINEVSDKAEHSWDTGVTDSITGDITYTCSVCGATKMDKHTHTFSADWTSDDTHHWHAATCGHTNEVSNKAEHNWGTGVTDSTTGDITYTCLVCGATKTDTHTHTFSADWTSDDTHHWHAATCGHTNEVSNKAEHNWGTGVTDSITGDITYTCPVCGATKMDTHTHTFSADWTSDDTHHWHAADCGHTSEVSDKAAHTEDGGTVTLKPSATAAGTRTFKCTVCGYVMRTESIPATGGSSGGHTIHRPSRPVHTPTYDSGSISEDVQPGENAPRTEIATPLDELADIVLTSDEKDEVNDGTDIIIILKIEDGTYLVPASDKAKVETVIGGMQDYKLGQYLDVNLLKVIGDIQENIHETDAPITVMFEIPEVLRGEGREYVVIRVHDGETAVLPDLDENADTVTIKTDKFSTYALAYSEKTDESSESASESSESTPESSESAQESSEPTPESSESAQESSEPTSEDSGPASESSEPTNSGDISGESSGDTSDNDTTSPSGETSSTDEESTDSGITPSTDDNYPAESEEETAESSENPPTGIAAALIPLAAAAVLIVAAKRKKRC